MMYDVVYIHPQDQEKAQTILIWSNQIICIGKFPINVLKLNPFNNQQEVHTIEPPEDYYTLLIDSQTLPAIFIHKDSYFEIRRDEVKYRKMFNLNVIK